MIIPPHPTIIGILGGLGPATTAHFYLSLINHVADPVRPNVVIVSLPIDTEKEARFISAGEEQNHFRHHLLEGADRLVKAGCDRIVIPCNTVHLFHAEIMKSVSIPVSNIISLTASEVLHRGWVRAVLLATSQTVRSKLFQSAFAGTACVLCLPSQHHQQRLDDLIKGLLKKENGANVTALLSEITAAAGTDCLILGCTDLQLAITPSDSVVDSLQTLVEDTALRLNGLA